MPDRDQFDFDVFISYSSRDKKWVRGELLERIEKAGLKVFIDYRDFTPGVRLRARRQAVGLPSNRSARRCSFCIVNALIGMPERTVNQQQNRRTW
jgi:hypothetical protein